jgi:hypothetical protein
VLERAGLISRGRAAQTRPCRLETAPLKRIAEWVDAYRHLWEDSFDRLIRAASTRRCISSAPRN